MEHFKIWCSVSGGVTGTREAWLKDDAGFEAVFTSLAEAERRAAELNKQMNGPHAKARFSYRAVRCAS